MYQPEFEEPWAFGLVSQHDPVSHIMEITMDQVCMKATFTKFICAICVIYESFNTT